MSLTEMQLKVLRCICEGDTSSDISEKVFLSKRRIDGIRLEIYKATGTKSVAQLVRWAVRNEIIKP